MTLSDILRLRLHNQNLTQHQFENPAEIVSWLGAVQSQDFYGAKWALGLRLKNFNDADIEKAFKEGAILRTHVLRPTWHFVNPKDVRWMLQLSAKRVIALMASQHRQLELDAAIVKKCSKALRKALQSRKYLSRDEIAGALKEAKIKIDGQRFIHLMMRAELDEVVCSGPRIGKQFTYALLDQQAPNAKTLKRDEALAELSLRYFKSHGPATLKDFAWWSGLTVSDAKAGVAMNKSKLIQENVDGKPYWFAESNSSNKKSLNTAFLLPNYDEYIISYADRSNLIDAEHSKTTPRGNAIFNHTIALNGKVVGTWQRTFKKNKVMVERKIFSSLSNSNLKAVDSAVKRFVKFMGTDRED